MHSASCESSFGFGHFHFHYLHYSRVDSAFHIWIKIGARADYPYPPVTFADGRPECMASCSPALPSALDADSQVCQSAVLAVAAVFKKESIFRA